MPARGNEKPVVENRIKTLQRRWGTPVPRVKDLAELNAYLRECCRDDLSRPSRDSHSTIAERFAHERQQAAILPRRHFDACIRQPAKVDKYQFVRFDNVCDSVPRTVAFKNVIVKGYVDRVEIVDGDQVVATHVRSYDAGDQILDALQATESADRSGRNKDEGGRRSNNAFQTPGSPGTLQRLRPLAAFVGLWRTPIAPRTATWFPGRRAAIRPRPAAVG